MALSFNLDAEQQAFLGRQAKLSIESVLTGDAEARPLWPGPECADRHGGLPLSLELGSFVTLSLNKALRGCIGTIISHEPLYMNVWNMARQAAFNDPRFAPLTSAEWPAVSMEITVLDQLTPCHDVNEIEIGRDGLLLSYMGRSGVFLPQVPVEQGWNREQYLDQLCLKAGVPAGTWRLPDASVYWYQAQVFPCQ